MRSKKQSQQYNRNFYLKKKAKLGVTVIITKNKKPKYSDCLECQSSDTYKFISKASYSQWLCNNCNSHFIIENQI